MAMTEETLKCEAIDGSRDEITLSSSPYVTIEKTSPTNQPADKTRAAIHQPFQSQVKSGVIGIRGEP